MIIEKDIKTVEKGINEIISTIKYYKDYDLNNLDLNSKNQLVGHLKVLEAIEVLEEVLKMFEINSTEYEGSIVSIIDNSSKVEKKDWSIDVKIYKRKDGKYFVLNIPKEMKEVGYKEECYIEKSKLLEIEELQKLKDNDCGCYSLTLKPLDNYISYEQVLEYVKDGLWTLFYISEYTKIF